MNGASKGKELSGRWRALRRRILTPSFSNTSLEVRGFHRKNPAAQHRLETIGRYFLTGYGYAVEARDPAEAEERLEQAPLPYRGFAYEGAGMGFAVLDGLALGRGDRFTRFLAGKARDHVYMVYIGAGWAMARLPRFRWSRIPELDPLLRWLVLDGYGFHQAYFHTSRYVHRHYRPARFPWRAVAPERYALRAIDQGIGRALWFVGGADPEVVATLIERFPASRHADLYSGAGLAATYAGGADEQELAAFRERAGVYRPQVAQGSVFAAEARVRAGLVVPDTGLATRVLCGLTPEQAAAVSRATRPDGSSQRGEPPAYEIWRQRIASEVLHAGGVST